MELSGENIEDLNAFIDCDHRDTIVGMCSKNIITFLIRPEFRDNLDFVITSKESFESVFFDDVTILDCGSCLIGFENFKSSEDLSAFEEHQYSIKELLASGCSLTSRVVQFVSFGCPYMLFGIAPRAMGIEGVLDFAEQVRKFKETGRLNSTVKYSCFHL